MEKDIDRISKNFNTDIVIRIDDFGGRRGVTIREFVKGEEGKYSGFTKAGTRIPADKFKIFKAAINSIDEADLESSDDSPIAPPAKPGKAAEKPVKAEKKEIIDEIEDQEF